MAHGENPCFPNFLENHLELGAKVAMMRLTTVAKLKSRPAGRAGPPMAFLYAMGNILQYSRNVFSLPCLYNSQTLHAMITNSTPQS
jgi:hypothetical protein